MQADVYRYKAFSNQLALLFAILTTRSAINLPSHRYYHSFASCSL
jgi:hypothetical protein